MKPLRWMVSRLGPPALLLLVWQLVAARMNNPVIAPGPLSVIQAMLSQLTSDAFWSSVTLTTVRALSALAFCMLSGILLAFAARKPGWLSSFLDSCVLFVRTLPNIAIIILLLFWFDRTVCVLLVSFLLVFPIVYTALRERLQQIDAEWVAVFRIYPQPFGVRLRQVYLPLLSGELRACLLSASSLCFKSTVMAEVLCQAAGGIGRSLQKARFDIDVAGVIGWTFWLLLIVFALHRLLKLGMHWINRKDKDFLYAKNQYSGSGIQR